MRPGARKLSILVSKSSGVTAAEMLKLLPSLRLSADICAADTGEIAALLAEKPADAAVLGADGFELACDICERPGTAVLIVAPDSAMVWSPSVMTGDLPSGCSARNSSGACMLGFRW